MKLPYAHFIPRLFWLTGLLLTSASCTDAGLPSSFAVRDSSGVRIVESHSPEWNADGGWRLSAGRVTAWGEVKPRAD